MLSPATLALGPRAGLLPPPSPAERTAFHPSKPPHLLLLPKRTMTTYTLLRHKTPSFPPLRAVVVDADQLGSAQPPEEEKKVRRYHFVVANAKFMLDEEEHFKELLFERRRNYGQRSKEQDFWLVVEPRFLDKFPDITRRLRRPAVALVSTNATWITFMKLRLDRVLADNFDADGLEEALASNPVDLQFEKPEKWVAPYPKYEYGWWETFLPPGSSKQND